MDNLIKILLALCLPISASIAATTSDYPSRAVSMIAAVAPGGQTDILARLIAQELSKKWNQPVQVDNRSGGGGIIGMNALAKSEPDGYTMALINPSLTGTLSTGRPVPYDRDDFVGVMHVANANLVILANKNAPFNDIAELVKYAEANPAKVTYASVGVATYAHLAMSQLGVITNTQFVNVPYRSLPLAVPDMLENRIHLIIGDIFAPVAYRIKQGDIKVIGTLGNSVTLNGFRIPAVSSVYLPVRAEGYMGIVVPRGTPRHVINKIHRDLAQILKDKNFVKKLEERSITVVGSTPEEFDSFLSAEIKKWQIVIQQSGLNLDQ